MDGPARGVTVRLNAEAHERVASMARAEHHPMAAFLEMLVDSEIAARDEADRVIRVHVAPELAGTPFGDPDRRPRECDRAYAARRRTIDTLFGR